MVTQLAALENYQSNQCRKSTPSTAHDGRAAMTVFHRTSTWSRPATSLSRLPWNGNSHIDALCHVFMDRKMYNGYTADTVKAQALLTAASWSQLKELLAGECFSTFPVYEGLNGQNPRRDHSRRARSLRRSTKRIRRHRRVLLIGTGRDNDELNLGPGTRSMSEWPVSTPIALNGYTNAISQYLAMMESAMCCQEPSR